MASIIIVYEEFSMDDILEKLGINTSFKKSLLLY